MIRRQARPTGSSVQHPLSLAWSLSCVGRIRPHVKSSDRQHDCQDSPARGWGEHLPPWITGADGRAPSCSRAAGRQGLEGRPPAGAGRLTSKGSSAALAASLGPTLQPSPPRPPASAACPLLVRIGKAVSPARQRSIRRPGLPGAGSRKRSAITATAARVRRQRRPHFPNTQNRPRGCTASRPRPRCVTATVGARTPGAGPTSGGGSCAGMPGFECREVPCKHRDVPQRSECRKRP